MRKAVFYKSAVLAKIEPPNITSGGSCSTYSFSSSIVRCSSQSQGAAHGNIRLVDCPCLSKLL